MSNPSLPPYLGSWEELLRALLHNPFLGSGKTGPPELLEAETRRSGRELVDQSAAVSLFVSGIGLKEVASKLSDAKLRNDISQAADQAIANFEDDYCGTQPHPHPRALLTAVELAAFASSLQEGNLRNEVFRVAGEIIQKCFGVPTATRQAAGATR